MWVRSGFIALVAVTCLSAWGAPCAFAADPELKLPSFEHLQSIAVETVNVTLGPVPMHLAALVLESSDDPKDRELTAMVKGIKAIRIHSFRFAADGQFNAAEVDAVRAQLSAPGWNALAKIRQHSDQTGDVDIYVSTDHSVVNGLAIIASGPRELTIVNIVGTIDPAKLAGISTRLGLPAFPL